MNCIVRTIFLLFLSLSPSLYGQTDFIKAGDFSDSAAWKLGIYSNAVAHGSITNEGYLVSIDNPGTDVWSIQFTQGGLKIDSGTVYRFSFEASSSKPRTIESSISMDGGSYFPYSGRDTISLTSTPLPYEWTFFMNQHTDTSARVEFNCGAYAGNVLLNNVKLVEIPGPFLQLETPVSGAQYYEGYPIEIKWISAGNQNPVRIELSTDNGFNWKDIISSTPDNGSYIWNPTGIYSPWCLIRISVVGDKKISSTNDSAFAFEPQTEMIRNGTFTNGASGWNLGVNGGKASLSTAGKACTIKIDSAGSLSWHIQFMQAGLHIQKGVTYVLSYTASAEETCSILVKVIRNGGLYETYYDSSLFLVNLTTEPHQFTTEFTASDTCSDARLEFDCGLTNADITLDNISLTKKYESGVKNRFKAISHSTMYHAKILLTGSGHKTLIPIGNTTVFSIIDLMGRKIFTGSNLSQNNKGKIAQGIYFSTPRLMHK